MHSKGGKKKKYILCGFIYTTVNENKVSQQTGNETTQAVSKIWLTVPGKPMVPEGASQIKSQAHTIKDL